LHIRKDIPDGVGRIARYSSFHQSAKVPQRSPLHTSQ